MLKWLKRISLTLLVIIVLLAIWIQIGSIDQESFDDRGLLSELKPVPDAENGFLDIAYMGEENFHISGEESLKDFSQGKKWDSAKVGDLLRKNSETINKIKESNKKPLFKLPEIHGDPLNLFSYQVLSNANGLLIIESRRYAQDIDYDRAIGSLVDSLLFSQRVMAEKNGSLISFMIGLRMKAKSLDWLYEMISRYEFSADQYQTILSVLGEMNPYFSDGMSYVAAGEFRFTKEMFESDISRSIKDRFEFFNKISEIAFQSESKGKAEFFSITMLPRFYTHKNTQLTYLAKEYETIKNNSGRYCKDIKLSGNRHAYEEYQENIQWFDLLKPNSSMRGDYFPGILSDRYVEYFERRCFFHVYADAIKTAVALKAYEKQHGGDLPKTLDVLVPNYLDRLPVDYFDGQPLRYSREKDWLYSVGADYKDDGGSVEGFYQGRCRKEEACFNNPTIELFTLYPTRLPPENTQ